MKKIDINEIQDKFKAYEAHYNTLHEQQKEVDNYYELTYDAGVPKKFPTRMPSTARDWIDNGVMHYTLDNPKASVLPRNDTESARDQAAILELFYTYWLVKDILRIQEAAKKLLIRGEVFLKVNMDDTYFGTDVTKMRAEELKEHEEARLCHFPLYLTVPDPINVFASPAQNGLVPVDVIECFNITVSEAMNLCERNGWKWDTDKAYDKDVKWMSYVSRDWRCFLLDDEPILPGDIQPNILGFTNYVRVPSGSGQTSYEGKPEYLYRSLLWGKRDMLKLEARLLSVIDAINQRWGFPRPRVKGNRDIQKLVQDLYPAGIPLDPDQWLYEIKDELEFDYLQGEQPPPALFQQMAMLQSYAHPPTVLGGVRPPGVYSGQHQETLLGSAKPIYKAAFKNLEMALGVAMGMGARIAEKVYQHPIQIRGSEGKSFQITPQKIKGYTDCQVHLLAESPEATDMRKMLGRTQRQSGSISHKTELKEYNDMSEKEAMDELAQIFAENALKEPAVRGPVALDAMTRLGMHKEREILEESQARAARPIPPTPEMGESPRGVRKRGRISPELESISTPHEGEIERALMP